MILIVVGLPGSGKSTIAEMLRGEKFDVIEYGDIWRELLKKAKIPLNDPKATREFTARLREKHGKDIYSKYAVKKIKKSMKHIVLMGLRSTYELDYIKKKVDKVDIIAVRSPFETRFNRLKRRAKPEDPKTIDDFKWLETREKRGFLPDKKEEKHGVLVIMKQADYVIDNSGTKEELKLKLDRVLSKIDKDWKS
jgi:dephospho-CoA kinase